MATKFHQISLKDTFADCQDFLIDDTPSFFQLLGEHFNISKFIPSVFVFYQPDDKFKNAHPEIPVEKKSESPNEDKSIGDSSSLNPILSNRY